MKGHIIQLPRNPHREIEALLPWYVTGQLDAADTARVEGHLAACAECSAALDAERRLDREITRRPADVETGWATLRERLDTRPHPDRLPAWRPQVAGGFAPAQAARRWFGWALGAQVALAALAVGFFVLPADKPAQFEALAAAGPGPAGNLVVIFRPETSERVLRQTLRAGDARLVDGPTAANAYVLQVPAATRDTVLATLRNQPQIVLAEPVDAGQRR